MCVCLDMTYNTEDRARLGLRDRQIEEEEGRVAA